ncbi:helix-turn-helix transcriptional regulator [Serratia sp. C2(1)]|uniref:helix-turn-helix transcriptional regulator n=1 Tax=Serratia sp. C2(1) TaxID=3117679 RepID=UPI003FA693E4
MRFKNVLKIGIFDQDLFFCNGLMLSLSAYFLHAGIDVEFVVSHGCADLIFESDYNMATSCYSHSLENNIRREYPIIFLICECHSGIRREMNYSKDRCVIYRNDSVVNVVMKVTYVLDFLLSGWESPLERYYSGGYGNLTEQETNVIRLIGRGFSPSQIAKILGINPKTVSSHKCTVMRKLHLTRNNELYHWLRQRGLIHIAR